VPQQNPQKRLPTKVQAVKRRADHCKPGFATAIHRRIRCVSGGSTYMLTTSLQNFFFTNQGISSGSFTHTIAADGVVSFSDIDLSDNYNAVTAARNANRPDCADAYPAMLRNVGGVCRNVQ
jgi:hypothetical protein